MLAILSNQEQGSSTLVYQVIHELKTIIRLEKLEENFRLQILNLIVPQITKNTYEIFSELVNETMQ